MTSAQEQNETSSGEHVEENLKMIGKQSEGKPRPTRSQKSVNEKQLPTDEQGENETSDGEQKEKLSEVEKQNESKPLPRMSRRSTEKRATTARSRKIVIDKSTMSVTAEQEVTKTTRCKTGVDKKPPVAEEQVKGNPRSARNRKSVVLEATQPNKSRTTVERESLASTKHELKESKTRSTSKMDNPPKLEHRESKTRSIRNRKQIDVKLSTATKQKESETKPTTCAEEMSSLATEQTESKTRSKRNRESTVEKPSTASVPERRASSRRSSLNVKVKATSDPLVPPKQKENVLVGKSPKRRQASLAPANDPDTSQPSKKSRGRQLPAVPPSSLSTSLRERHPSSRPRVMFTGMFDSHGEQILKSLGGHIVDSVYECTHLVTDRVRRTVKFLCGIGRGIPIVGPGWLLSCREANTFTDVDRFLVQDEENEKKFHFSLVTSLQKAASGGLLVGYRVHVTANVKPEPKQMKDIIQCAGGEYLPSPPCSYQEKTVVVSCDANKAVCQRTLDGNIPVVSAEFLLTGILRQEVELDQYPLTIESMSSTWY
ncbi:hypothetical protein LSAT2_021845 [Lamellibrachia satsuma]|nr:hypothetical protein LSAT2_021845 [Lamellibrachia satsuma]